MQTALGLAQIPAPKRALLQGVPCGSGPPVQPPENPGAGGTHACPVQGLLSSQLEARTCPLTHVVRVRPLHAAMFWKPVPSARQRCGVLPTQRVCPAAQTGAASACSTVLTRRFAAASLYERQAHA